MVEDDNDPVIQRLQFGERARQHREAAGIEFAVAEKRIGGYAGKLSKIETGAIGPKPADVEVMIQMYGLASGDADELRQLGKDARRRSVPRALGGKYRQYVSLERLATDIQMVYPEVPGLLQTQRFAYALLSHSPTIPGGEAMTQAQERAARGAEIVRPGGPNIWIVLGEEALHWEIGGRQVLRDQLVRLREIADLDNVSLRIVPWSAGACAALASPFTLLYVPPARTIAYVETLTRADYIKATGPYMSAFETAQRISETEDASRAIIDSRLSDLN